MEIAKKVMKSYSEMNRLPKFGIKLLGVISFSYVSFISLRYFLVNRPKIDQPSLGIKEFIKNEIWTC